MGFESTFAFLNLGFRGIFAAKSATSGGEEC